MGRTVLDYLWKTPLCVLTYLVGIAAGGAVATSLGLSLPAIPAAAGGETSQLSGLLVGCTLLVLSLGPLAKGVRGGLVARWLILAAFAYVCLGVNTAIEAGIFTKFGGMSGMAVITAVPCALSALVVSLLFPPQGPAVSFRASLRRFAGRVDGRRWLGRVFAAVLAFPLIYFVFGMPVGLLVGDYYRQEAFGLVLPSLSVVIGTQLLRSVLYLLASLPIVVAWSGSRREFIFVFGIALFVFTGLFGMVQASWLPVQIRLIHTVELFADAMAYAGALAVLLRISGTNCREVAPLDRVPDVLGNVGSAV
jgi:hypothetical protein